MKKKLKLFFTLLNGIYFFFLCVTFASFAPLREILCFLCKKFTYNGLK